MSSDPRRLVENEEIPEDVRADLDWARQVTPAYDVEGGLGRFEAALGAGPISSEGGAAGMSGGAEGAADASGTALSAMKGLAWVGVVSAVGVAGVAAVIGALSVRTPAAPLGESRRVAPTPVTGPTPLVQEPLEQVAPAPRQDPQPSNHRSSPRRRARKAPASSEPPRLSEPVEEFEEPGEPKRPSPAGIRVEIAHLAKTRQALRADPSLALALATAGQREFKDGLFGEEREAIAIFALVRLDREREARERARGFVDRYPNGPFTERVRRVVGPLH